MRYYFIALCNANKWWRKCRGLCLVTAVLVSGTNSGTNVWWKWFRMWRSKTTITMTTEMQHFSHRVHRRFHYVNSSVAWLEEGREYFRIQLFVPHRCVYSDIYHSNLCTSGTDNHVMAGISMVIMSLWINMNENISELVSIYMHVLQYLVIVGLPLHQPFNRSISISIQLRTKKNTCKNSALL